MYKGNNDLPVHLKSMLPWQIQEAYRQVFNQAYQKAEDDGLEIGYCEKSAHREAWAMVNQQCLKASI